MIESTLKLVEDGRDLSMQQMAEATGLIMEGRCDEDQIARLLSALHRKGETVAEVAGAARAMRRQMTPIRTSRSDAIDTCGTGGDGSRTFNISTAAAVVTAAAGVPVAKHGNRGITSRSGSADVLVALGVNVEADVPLVEACLEELGICFCFAPLMHRAMKHVGPVRKKLDHPTVFNILGPLVNPASAAFQLLGVGRAELRPLLAEALAMLGTRRSLIVHGSDGLDEVTLAGATDVTEAADGKLREFQWTPADFGLEPAGRETMLVDGPEQSAAMIREILDGRTGPPRDIVTINAAAALWIAGRDDSPAQCARLAAEAIDSGAARDLLARLAERSCAR
ncbi:MAG: anthranilate phosphoribosyltransferase [Candidatus Nealsonbacteria bacterium]|nr:anthranilate phosphoribosyltransferase [Candidatus Nealsonbacteria bacterium]